MSKAEELRDQAIRARALSQTVGDDQSAKALAAVVQKYENQANQLELFDGPVDGAIQKTHPPDGWVSTALSEIDPGKEPPNSTP